MKRLWTSAVLSCLVAASLVACDAKKAPSAEADAPAPRPTRPQDILAHTTAKDAVTASVSNAVKMSYRQSEKALRRQSAADVPSEVRDKAQMVTLLFGANNHGEREDCGCKANPLGGLSRRQTLIELAATPKDAEAEKWWGKERSTPKATFVVDAGDLFYKSVTADKASKEMREQADYDAESVARALKMGQTDVINVGELDLVFGLDRLQKLGDMSGATLISANLVDENQKPAFKPFETVERDGVKFAFVGLTKPSPRVKGYYEERKLNVYDPHKSYEKVWPTLPQDAVVVVLSNLGLTRSRELLESLPASSMPDMVVVSNSNRLTNQPEWVKGVPLVEPLSRGKYFGRADLYMQGEGRPTFANVSVDPRRAIQGYRRAWTTYAAARKRFHETIRQQQKLQLESSVDRAKAGDAGANVDTTRQRKAREEYLAKELARAERRLQITSDQLRGSASDLMALEAAKHAAPAGDDWLDVDIVQVKLDIPEAGGVRKVLDARESKRPSSTSKGPRKRKLEDLR